MNVLAISKDDGERYIFLYDDESHSELLQLLGGFAADHELTFSWRDAADLARTHKKRVAEYFGSDDAAYPP